MKYEGLKVTDEQLLKMNGSLRSLDDYCAMVCGHYWSYEGQQWVQSMGAVEAMAADCLTRAEWISAKIHAVKQVKEIIRRVGVAVVNDDWFATTLEKLGFVTVPCVDYFDDEDFHEEFTWVEVFATKEDAEDFYDNCDRSVLKDAPEDDYVEEAYVEEEDGSYSYPLLDEQDEFGDSDIVYQFVKALRSNWYRPEYAWECVFGDEEERRHQDFLTPVEQFCEEMSKLRAKDMEKEDIFCGRYIKGFYNPKDGTGYFSTMKDEKTVDYTLSHESWMSICVDIEENPNDYNIEVYTFCDDGRGYLFHRLDEMPFDKWDASKWEFIHATGVEYLEVNGDWVTEYEDECEDEDDDKVILFAE